VCCPGELRCICTTVECYRRWQTTSDDDKRDGVRSSVRSVVRVQVVVRSCGRYLVRPVGHSYVRWIIHECSNIYYHPPTAKSLRLRSISPVCSVRVGVKCHTPSSIYAFRKYASNRKLKWRQHTQTFSRVSKYSLIKRYGLSGRLEHNLMMQSFRI